MPAWCVDFGPFVSIRGGIVLGDRRRGVALVGGANHPI
jgi:hypothetical protein